MEILIEKAENVNVITLKGSLLAEVQSRELLEKFQALIAEGEVNFIFDLGELEFINSSGLGLLLTCLTKSRKAGGEVILANVPGQVNNLLVMTKLNNIFYNTDNIPAALKKFEK
ncbi:MAG: anti-sigma factor antagonist [Chitinophagaceae bacterium]|nr:MAG: anti-sigma factor antagonist [Chitinophagaceae bacterium]